MDATPPTMKDMEAENGFSTSMLTFAAVMTIMIMIVGILGNFLTVAALIKCPKVRNVAAAFIMSLCIADLLFCALVLPFSAYRFIQGTWTPREFLCKMIPFIQYGNIGVSLLCIAMITINRYVMIAHHSSYGRIYKRHWIAAMIIFCWVFSYGMQLPTLVGAWGTFDYDPKLGTCSIMSDDYGRSSKTTLFITAFVIPCLIIIACYTKIFWVVHKSEQRLKRHANKQNSIPNNLRVIVPPTASSNADMINGQSRVSSADSSSFSTDVKQESVQKQTSRIKDQREVRAKRNEWRITKMVLAIFLSFVICYLPITIAKVADQDVEHPSLHIMSYIMLYLSACLNPIIYVIMNKQYRKAYKTVIMCQPGRLLNFGKGAGLGGNGADAVGSSVAEMERYRIEPQSQSHFGIPNVGNRSTKYQLQQFRPNVGTIGNSPGIADQQQYTDEYHYKRCNNRNDTDIYRDEFRVKNERTIVRANNIADQQRQEQQQCSPLNCDTEEFDYNKSQQQKQRVKSHNSSGRRYNFGRGRRGGGGGGGGGVGGGGGSGGSGGGGRVRGRKGKSEGNIIVQSKTTGTETATNGNRTDRTALNSCPNSGSTSSTHASVRQCERLASEEKPILRSEHQRHTR